MTPHQPSPPVNDHSKQEKTKEKKNSALSFIKLYSVTAWMTYVKVYYRFKTIILFGLLQMYMCSNVVCRGLLKKKSNIMTQPVTYLTQQCQDL